jgi:uncharacterized membrane protein
VRPWVYIKVCYEFIIGFETEHSILSRWRNGFSWKRIAAVTASSAIAGWAIRRNHPFVFLAGGIGMITALRLPRRKSSFEAEMPFEQVTRTITINSGRRALFTLVREMKNAPKFLPIVKGVTQIDGTRGVWTVATWKLSFLVDIDVIRESKNESLMLSFACNGRPIGDCAFEFHETAEGQTQVSATLRWHPLLGGAVEPLARPFMINEADTFLLRLKQLCETGEVARAK